MELENFIKEALVQISKGIKSANKSLTGTGAIVNPPGIQAYSDNAQAYGRVNKKFVDKESIVELIKFDVAITVEAGKEKRGGMKLSIASVSIGGDGKKHDSTNTESRIQFQIPMVYPHGEN